MESYNIYRVEFWSEPDGHFMQEYFRCPLAAAQRVVDLQGHSYYPAANPTIETVIVY